MVELSDLVRAREASIAQIVETLDGINFKDMVSDLKSENLDEQQKREMKQQIIDITRGLYAFESVIRAGTKNPNEILKGYEQFIFYCDVKGTASDEYAATQAKRLGKHRRTLMRHTSKEAPDVNNLYAIKERQYQDINDVREQIRGLGNKIYDDDNFENVLNAVANAYQTKELVSSGTPVYFGSNWLNARRVVSSLDWGNTTIDKLKESAFFKGAIQQAATILQYHLCVMDKI